MVKYFSRDQMGKSLLISSEMRSNEKCMVLFCVTNLGFKYWGSKLCYAHCHKYAFPFPPFSKDICVKNFVMCGKPLLSRLATKIADVVENIVQHWEEMGKKWLWLPPYTLLFLWYSLWCYTVWPGHLWMMSWWQGRRICRRTPVVVVGRVLHRRLRRPICHSSSYACCRICLTLQKRHPIRENKAPAHDVWQSSGTHFFTLSTHAGKNQGLHLPLIIGI